jgi:GntR family transcriptional regulator
LQLAPGAPTYRLERLRGAANLPLLLEQVELPAERFPDLLTADLEHGSLYDFLATRYGCRIVRLRETIEPVLPPAREARILNESRRRPMLLLVGTAFAEDGMPVEYSRTYVPGERSKFLIETTGRWARGLRSIRGTGGNRTDGNVEALLLTDDRAGGLVSEQR